LRQTFCVFLQACLPVQFTDDQAADYIQRVLDPLSLLQRHGWYHPAALAGIAQLR
jgi:hypothetical protein